MDGHFKSFGIILLIVIGIMAYLWWSGDKQRIKRINELKEEIAVQEERIAELEYELYGIRGY